MKGIAVPYIIALILGIVVVALIGFWFFVLGGGIPGQQSIQYCNIVLQKYCNEWSKSNFADNAKTTIGITQVGIADAWDADNNPYSGSVGCKGLGVVASAPVCKQLFGITTTTPAGGGIPGSPF